jgi:hypothetical protein
MPSTAVSHGHRRGYVILGVLLVLWVAVLMAIALTVIPDGYWYSYYSVDYTLGFVRRGLAGEFVGVFPRERYFDGLRVLRWFPTVFFSLGLAAVAWTVAIRSGRSERRLMMALLIPVLPFGFAFGLFSARPDLFGAAALAGFAVALTTAATARSVVVASVVYGLAIAVLTLAHEAIPFLFGLGAIAALTVFARQFGEKVFRVSAAIALAPGLMTALVVAALGRRGHSAQLCQLVPHGPTNHPLAGKPTVGQLLRGFHYYVDYHDWVCRAILPLFDQSLGDAARFVGSLGVGALAASTAFGVGVLAIAILAISHVSGVPFGRFRKLLQERPVGLVIGFALVLPVFVTGVDWIRWWVIIAFDIGIVFLLYAAGQPEADRPATRRTLTVFAIGAVLLAVFPVGIIPGFGAPVPM